MTHYGIEQWVDFSRDLVGPEEREQMTGHLAGGCAECEQLSSLTSRLVVTCGNLMAIEVPDYALRMARAIFPVRAPERPKRGNRLPIELIFDSFLVPAPVGLRSTWQVGWQGLYRAGPCSVDLRIEPELKSPRAAVIGQISNHVVPAEAMGDLAITLRAGKLVVAETNSNRFGEFQLEYEQQSRLKLCIHLRDSKLIQLPLLKLLLLPIPAAARAQVSPVLPPRAAPRLAALKKLTSEQPAAKGRASRGKR
jgi:hypothetical protein